MITPFVKNQMIRLEILDKPDYRKIHKYNIPKMGGIAIYFGFSVGMLVSYLLFVDQFAGREIQLLGLTICGTLLVVVGMFDDTVNIRAWTKLIFQLAIAFAMIFFGYRIDIISNPFGDPIVLGWWSYPITVFWFISIINAINLVDGLDGLASGVALIVGLAAFVISMYYGKMDTALLAMAFVGSILGFMRHNFHPAKIFMGDTGSMFLGFVIASLGIMSSQKTAVSLAILAPIIALGYPILDTFLAIIRRARSKRHIFSPDKEHIHHILLEYGYSHRTAVIIIYGICVFFSAMALLMAMSGENSTFTVAIIFVVSIFAFVFVRVLSYLKRKSDVEGDDLLEVRIKSNGGKKHRLDQRD